jgi:hypothetical protein
LAINCVWRKKICSKPILCPSRKTRPPATCTCAHLQDTLLSPIMEIKEGT